VKTKSNLFIAVIDRCIMSASFTNVGIAERHAWRPCINKQQTCKYEMGTLIDIDRGNPNWSRAHIDLRNNQWSRSQALIEIPINDLGTETGQQSIINLCTRIGKFLQRQRAQILIVSSHGYLNMVFSSLLCLLGSTSSAVTSHWGTSIGNRTATDRRMIIVDCLSLLIDHVGYFVCHELELVTLSPTGVIIDRIVGRMISIIFEQIVQHMNKGAHLTNCLPSAEHSVRRKILSVKIDITWQVHRNRIDQWRYWCWHQPSWTPGKVTLNYWSIIAMGY